MLFMAACLQGPRVPIIYNKMEDSYMTLEGFPQLYPTTTGAEDGFAVPEFNAWVPFALIEANASYTKIYPRPAFRLAD